MKKAAAFLTALILAAGSIFGIHIWAKESLYFNNPAFNYWTAEQKFNAPEVVRENMDKNTLLVLASSELEHGQSTPYHPSNIFQGNTFQMMLMGAGHYQSLSHAITLAALEPAMEKRKVAILVSPQWFNKNGVSPKAFASRFSESSFIDMLENSKLSDKTKEYITRRSVQLLSPDEPMQKRVESYEQLFKDEDQNLLELTKFKLYKGFLDDKQRQSVLTVAAVEGIRHQKEKNLKSGEPDWENYYSQAAKDAEKATSNNQFQILNKYFNWKIKPELEKRKGSSAKSSYDASEEYGDLTCFMDVCKELDIQPMLVLLPVNGKWYDYTKFPKEKLEKFYSNVTKITEEYPSAVVVDLSEESYKDYFMEDTIHIGWKGWVKVDEILYQFGNEDKSTPQN